MVHEGRGTQRNENIEAGESQGTAEFKSFFLSSTSSDPKTKTDGEQNRSHNTGIGLRVLSSGPAFYIQFGSQGGSWTGEVL